MRLSSRVEISSICEIDRQHRPLEFLIEEPFEEELLLLIELLLVAQSDAVALELAHHQFHSLGILFAIFLVESVDALRQSFSVPCVALSMSGVSRMRLIDATRTLKNSSRLLE